MMQPMGMPGAPMFPPQAAAHAQMVFTTTQRPQAKIGGQQTRTYNILPMISFKVWRIVNECCPAWSRRKLFFVAFYKPRITTQDDGDNIYEYV